MLVLQIYHPPLIHSSPSYLYLSNKGARVSSTDGSHEDSQHTETAPTTHHVTESCSTWKFQGTHGWYPWCMCSLHAWGTGNIQKTWPVCFLTLLMLFLTLLGLNDGSIANYTLVAMLAHGHVALSLGMCLSISSWMTLTKVCSSF